MKNKKLSANLSDLHSKILNENKLRKLRLAFWILCFFSKMLNVQIHWTSVVYTYICQQSMRDSISPVISLINENIFPLRTMIRIVHYQDGECLVDVSSCGFFQRKMRTIRRFARNRQKKINTRSYLPGETCRTMYLRSVRLVQHFTSSFW